MTSGIFGSHFTVGASIPRELYLFKCPECSFTKNSSEDLEIHIKTEHINWLPFKCPIAGCPALRASDNQMREHVHSHHKRNDNRYIYMDNASAKVTLQEMMDRALFETSSYAALMHQPQKSTDQFNENGFLNSVSAPQISKRSTNSEKTFKRSRLDDLLPTLVASIASNTSQQFRPITETATSSIGNRSFSLQHNNDFDNKTLEATGNSIANDTDVSMFDDLAEQVDEFTSSQLSQIFGTSTTIKPELCGGLSDVSPPKLLPSLIESLPADESIDNRTMLQNVAALFSAADKNVQSFQQEASRKKNTQSRGMSSLTLDWATKRRQRRIGLSTAKRRVLGECSQCHRPVTAGARQMHVFFHLGKDQNTYRFRCKHPGCTVEHYRKDQMENHQSKNHGKIDPDMMEDRSAELYTVSQKLSMELLGTSGNTPGPTAAKAQAMYDNLQKTAELNAFRKRRKPGFPSGLSLTNLGQNSQQNMEDKSEHCASEESNEEPGGLDEAIQGPNSVENLECMLCHKFIMSRIKGFHILWHLNNDLGIIRYGCRHCDYKHDRPQSIATHGKREHTDDDSCEDLLYKYEEEVKSMSKSCFGVEKIFAKEIKRRSQVERKDNISEPIDNVKKEADVEEANEDETMEDVNEELEDTSSHHSADDDQYQEEEEVQQQAQRTLSGSIFPTTQKKKARSMRRFGTRRPKSKKQKEEMVKLREISMHLGGGQYFKKRGSEIVTCEQCGKTVNSRLTEHAYSHLDGLDLFKCNSNKCNLGHYSRDMIVRHLKDFHGSNEVPIDNRLKYAHEIKQVIKNCYPEYFVDAPVPTKETIDKLKACLKFGNTILTGEGNSEMSNEKDRDENCDDGVCSNDFGIDMDNQELGGDGHDEIDEDD